MDELELWNTSAQALAKERRISIQQASLILRLARNQARRSLRSADKVGSSLKIQRPIRTMVLVETPRESKPTATAENREARRLEPIPIRTRS